MYCKNLEVINKPFFIMLGLDNLILHYEFRSALPRVIFFSLFVEQTGEVYF